MADEEEHVENIKRQLANLFYASLRAAFPNEPDDIEPLVAASMTKFGDYQCTNALGLFTKFKCNSTHHANVRAVEQDIMINLPPSEMIESCSIGGLGFVNVKLSNDWIAKSLQKMLVDGIETQAPRLLVERVVVDFSSPTIAKEMHVGHLRSTIIGDPIARMLEFSIVEVLRCNHVGDWGTQFGMLIEYLFEKFRMLKTLMKQPLVIYRGECFYNPYIPKVIAALSNQGLIEVNEDAHVIFSEGFKIPLIVLKKDGGYNYASTDLVALWYRLNVLVGFRMMVHTLKPAMLVLALFLEKMESAFGLEAVKWSD